MAQEIVPLNSPDSIPFRGRNTDSSAGVSTPDTPISNLRSAMCEIVDPIHPLLATYFHVISTGPYPWRFIEKMTISMASDSSGLYIWPLQGDLSLDTLRVLLSSPPIPLLPGLPLVGMLYWTKRELAVGPVWGLSTVGAFGMSPNAYSDCTKPSIPIFTAEVAPLLSAPSNASSPNVTTLMLLQRFTYATKFVQDVVDATALSGVATFGGFWTFLNGTFALFFGANVIYFAFGEAKVLVDATRGAKPTHRTETTLCAWFGPCIPAVRAGS
jgi:hypothetical protein